MLGRVDLIIGSQAQIELELAASGFPINTVQYLAPAFISRPSFALSKQTPMSLVKRVKSAYQQLLSQDICLIMKINVQHCIKPPPELKP